MAPPVLMSLEDLLFFADLLQYCVDTYTVTYQGYVYDKTWIQIEILMYLCHL
jgi:hypothetical protein